ncbi:hypothetical protein GA0070607_1736 [Micromonospora coriariae]|uniref:Uncharacterized protein n=1 Tax=Micromonospora coriariae TaxID=285665 RepID=A0A1C4V807_9ACTN|nr:hypothetical protein GA0070607_1736 [Micromonospora coriariae]
MIVRPEMDDIVEGRCGGATGNRSGRSRHG